MIKRICVAALLTLLAATAFAAAPPQLVSYQGLLKGSGGNPLTGTFAMTFAFYDAASGGTLLLTDAHPAVGVSSGLFTVILGAGTVTPGSEANLEGVFGQHGSVWMEVRVGAQALTPRTRLLASGFAANSSLLDGKDSTAFALTGHVHAAADITSGAVAAARGGTGLTSPGTAGNLLTSTGAGWTSTPPAFLSSEVDGVIGNEVTAATNATLTRSGAGTGGSPFTLGLNLGNANTWSGAQTFGASTYFPASGIWDSVGRVGIGINTGLMFPLAVKASQAVAQLYTTTSTNGSVLQLFSEAASPTYLGTINFANAGGTPGQIAYLGSNAMAFKTNSLERLRINAAGYVGIGTTTPGVALDVLGVQSVARVTSTGSSNPGSVLVLQNTTASPTHVGGIYFNSFPGGFIDYLGANHMTFGTAGTERLRLDATGNVGIGTSTPAVTLDVQAPQGVARLTSTANTNGSVLVLKNSTASPTYVGAINFNDSAAGQIGYLGSNHMTFRANGAEAMRIDSDGWVGVGTTAPDGQFHVRWRNSGDLVAIVGEALEIGGYFATADFSGQAYVGQTKKGIRALGDDAGGEFDDLHSAHRR